MLRSCIHTGNSKFNFLWRGTPWEALAGSQFTRVKGHAKSTHMSLLACCEEGSKKSYRRRWTAGNSLVAKPLPYRHSCLYIVLFFDTLPLFVVVSRWGLFHTAWKERYCGYGQQGPAYKWISVLYHVTARSLDGHEICCFRVRIIALCIKTWKITALLLLLNISKKKKSEKWKRDLATALPDSYLTTPINEWESALCIRYPINWILEVCIYSVLWISNDRSQMKMNSLS